MILGGECQAHHSSTRMGGPCLLSSHRKIIYCFNSEISLYTLLIYITQLANLSMLVSFHKATWALQMGISGYFGERKRASSGLVLTLNHLIYLALPLTDFRKESPGLHIKMQIPIFLFLCCSVASRTVKDTAQRYELLLSSEHTNKGWMEMCHPVVFPVSPMHTQECHISCNCSTLPALWWVDVGCPAHLLVGKGSRGHCIPCVAPHRC